MTTRWPALVVAILSGALALFGLLNLIARNWLWGDAGFDTEARQPIMLLAILAIAVGLSGCRAALRGSTPEQLFTARILVVVVATLPTVAALNIAGWDRVWEATGISVGWVGVAVGLVVGFPLILATRTLSHQVDP